MDLPLSFVATITAQAPQPAATKTLVDQAAAAATGIRSTLVDTLLIALFIAVLVALIRELRRTSVVIEPIDVPKDLAEQGLGPAVVAQRIAAYMSRLKRTARIRSSSTEEGIEPSASQIDFTVPTAGISYRGLIRYGRQLIGRPEQRIRGDIIRTPHPTGAKMDVFTISLRTFDGRQTSAQLRASAQTDLGDLIHRAAFEIAAIVDPYLVASYHFWNEQADRRFEQTVEAIGRCLNSSPASDHHRAYVLWAQVLTVQRRFADAERQLKMAVELEPGFAQIYNCWGNIRRAQHKYDEAEACYRRSIRCDRRQSHVWSNLGYVFTDRKQYQDALRHFGRSLRLDPRFSAALTGRALALLRLGRSAEAEDGFARSIAVDPGYAWAYLHMARFHMSQRRFEVAEHFARLATERTSNHAEAFGMWGDVLVNTRDYSAAETKYEAASAKNPRLANGAAGFAFLRRRQRRFTESLDYCQQAATVDPYFSSVLLNRAECLRALRKYSEADHTYDQALNLDPYLVGGLVGRGQLRRIYHDVEGALSFLRRAVELEPTDLWARFSWGNALVEKHEYGTALLVFEQALRIDPSEVRCRVGIGDALSFLGRPVEAVAQYQRAHESDRRNAFALRRLAERLIDIGEQSRALAAFESVLTGSPDDSELLTAYGEILRRLDRIDQAASTFELAARIDPLNANALTAWSRVTSNRYEAVRLARLALRADPSNDWSVRNAGLAWARFARFTWIRAWYAIVRRRLPYDTNLVLDYAGVCLRHAQRAGSPAERAQLEDEALTQYEAAQSLDPLNPGPLCRKGDWLLSHKQLQAALVCFEAATEVDPASVEAWRGTGRAFEALQNPTSAVAAYRKALRFRPGDARLKQILEELLQRSAPPLRPQVGEGLE